MKSSIISKLMSLIICWISSVSLTKGQSNLITNWSFEDTIPCVTNPNWFSVVSAPPWTPICQSPDYQSQIYCGSGLMTFGYQLPKSGNAFIGAGIYSGFSPNSARETFGQHLQDTLLTGHTYCVEFYVSLAESSYVAIDRIGALFTPYPIDQQFVFSFVTVPQVQNLPGNIISDTTNWVLISGDFISQGNETFISLGNFYNDQNTQNLQLPFGDTISKNSYYYFDDISVIDCTVGFPEYSALSFNVFPNPALFGKPVTLTFDSSINKFKF